jgi:plasmid stabilization system protein ParE
MASVVFTEPAEYDLLDIEYYISVDLCNPQAAQRISDGILDAAEKLSDFQRRINFSFYSMPFSSSNSAINASGSYTVIEAFA